MVKIIVRPDIEWYGFVSSLETSPTRGLDSVGIPVGSLLSFILSLGQVEYSNVPPSIFIKSDLSRSALQHLSYSFAFECSVGVLLEILQISKVAIISTGDITKNGIMSGTVLQFRDLVIQGMAKDQSEELREFLFEIFQIFLGEGFRAIFGDHRLGKENDTIYLQLEK